MAKTEERINLDALAYNLTILYNIKQEIKTQQKIQKISAKAHPLKTNYNPQQQYSKKIQFEIKI